MFTAKRVQFAQSLMAAALSQAIKEVRGRRNQQEAAVGIAKRLVEPITEIVEINPGDTIVRSVGKELGTKRYSDYRTVIDIVHVANVSDKMIIGLNGERVRPETVIAVEVLL